MLLEADPETYSKPAYLHQAGWISINLERDSVDWGHVADRIAASWELAAPRRLLEAGGR
jgi:predicted DNA-binding protein (MmcQ/YjbR family)